jgi:hypothetical protein
MSLIDYKDGAIRPSGAVTGRGAAATPAAMVAPTAHSGTVTSTAHSGAARRGAAIAARLLRSRKTKGKRHARPYFTAYFTASHGGGLCQQKS